MIASNKGLLVVNGRNDIIVQEYAQLFREILEKTPTLAVAVITHYSDLLTKYTEDCDIGELKFYYHILEDFDKETEEEE